MGWPLKKGCGLWKGNEKELQFLKSDAGQVKSRVWACPKCESLHLTKRGKKLVNRLRELARSVPKLVQKRSVPTLVQKPAQKRSPKYATKAEWLEAQKKACARKQRYDSWEASVFFAKARGLRSYKCPICPGYHMTSAVKFGHLQKKW